MEIIKVDNNQIKVTKVESVSTENVFTYEYLTKQREAILDLKKKDNEARDKELEEIDILLAECDKLQVTAKPIVEPTI
jgi:hypothetical protein